MTAGQTIRLTILGSADAYNAAGRGHSCYWLEDVAGDAVMIDCGATALAGIERAGVDLGRLRAILFTHLHGDHAAGFPFLMIDAAIRRRRQRGLTVVGPDGCRERLGALCEACYPELLERRRGFPLDQFEIAPGGLLEVAGYELRAFSADHGGEATPALMLDLRRDGFRALFTGDTAFSERLPRLALGADLLVADCTEPEPGAGRHCSWRDWRPHLAGLARTVVFSHLSAEMRAALPALRREIPPGVELHFGEDGLQLTIEAGTFPPRV